MDFIQVQRFDNYIEAHIVLGRLQSEGINCLLKDENLNPISFLDNVESGVQLMVAQDQAQKAMEILKGQ